MRLPTTVSEFKDFLRRGVAFAAAASIVVTPAVGFSVPLNGVVSDGSANINNVGSGVIVNQASDRAVIDWQGFDVNSGESANFNVPSANSITLNRIHSATPSQIYGKVSSNGNLMLINRNGMVFGKDSQVDVNGLIATTSDISNKDFKNGKLNFHSGGNSNAAIVNNGTITLKNGGSAALVAPSVINNGTITANMGKVSLAAGDAFTVDMYGDNLVQLAVPEDITKALVENTGTIRAKGGKVQIESSIDHIADSLINLSGVVDVSNTSGKGGRINATAKYMNLTGAILDASGEYGGGIINLGGGYMGSGTLKHATNVSVDKDTWINVNANNHGNGGEAIIWSDGQTNFNGSISARGGQYSGDGGLIETSGYVLSTTGGKADAFAPNGKSGTWLLDPYDITIFNGSGADSNIGCVGGNPSVCTPTNSSVIWSDNISAALSAGTSVFITTGIPGGDVGNITVNGANILMNTFAGTATLTLQAANWINIGWGLTISAVGASVLNVVLNSDSDANQVGKIYVGGTTISTNGGNITMGGGALSGGVPTAPAYGNPGWETGVDINNSTLDAGGGNIWISGAGEPSASWDGAGFYGNTTVRTTGNGSITVHGRSGQGTFSAGVAMWAGDRLFSTQHGDITIVGTGISTSTSDNYGTLINGSNDIIETTGNGNIYITGTGGPSTAAQSIGVGLYGTVRTTGAGSVNITGYGGGAGAGANNYGLFFDGARINTNTGAIVLTGREGTGTGGSNHSLNNGWTPSTVNSTSGNISAFFDSYVFNTSFTSTTTGNTQIAPYTDSRTIGVMGGAGAFQIDNALLANFNSGSYTFGKTTGTGALTANARVWTLPVTLLNGSADIVINGLQNMGANPFVARTVGAGDVVLGAAGAVSSTAAGNNIILAAGRNFLNNSMVGTPLSTGGGNRLIYSTSPVSNVMGTITGSYYLYSCVYLGACPALGVGNGLLYSTTPILNVTPNAKTITAGSPAGLSPYSYTLSGYAGSDATLDVVGGVINGSTAYTLASGGGSYDITYASGALTSTLGYGFNYLANPTGLTVLSGAWSGGGGTSTPSFTDIITTLPPVVTPPAPDAIVSPLIPSSPETVGQPNVNTNTVLGTYSDTVLGSIVKSDTAISNIDNNNSGGIALPSACLSADENSVVFCNSSQILSGFQNQ